MIARIWHGWTKRTDANAYEKLLRDEIFPGIAALKIEGYRGAELFIREDGNEVEFVTLLRFDSMDAVKKFAGPDAIKPVIYPKAEALITRMGPGTTLSDCLGGTRCPQRVGQRCGVSRLICASGVFIVLGRSRSTFGKRSACPTTDVRDFACNGTR